MGILKDFFNAMRHTNCHGCGQTLSVCNSACREAKQIDEQLYHDIK